MDPASSCKTSDFIAGRLALDFANTAPSSRELSWGDFLLFLADAGVITAERASRLSPLADSDPQAVDAVRLKMLRLRESVRAVFSARSEKSAIAKNWVEPINDILRITEGHDELSQHDHSWHLQFMARENGLEWLLAAIARSAAELLVEGPDAPVRRCANPNCRLFFYDNSRTRRRRWCSMATCGNRHKVSAFLKRRKRS
jgi:predicted RNA-binding Zn ribbon-like protein